MYHEGYYPKHRLFSILCKQHRLNPVCRAILEHLHDSCDPRTAIVYTSAGRIAGDICSTRKKVILAQQRLKRAGLLVYSDQSNSTHMYYLPLHIVQSSGTLLLTRPWQHSERMAIAADKKMSGIKLFAAVAAAPMSWTSGKLAAVLAIKLEPGHITDVFVEPKTNTDKQAQSPPEPERTDDVQDEINKNAINEIMKIYQEANYGKAELATA